MSTATITQRAPGPDGHWLTGCLSAFRRDPLGLLQCAADKYGDLVRIRIGPVLTHLLNHPDYVQHVLVHRAHGYDKQTRSVSKIRATCGQSLLTTDGPPWLRQRKLIQPWFQPRHLETMLPEIRDTIAEHLRTWDDLARTQQPLEIVSATMQLTLVVAARALFGADVHPDVEVVGESLEIILDDTWRRLESAIDWSAISPSFHRRRYREALQNLNDVVYRLFDARRQQPRRHDLLSALLQANGQSSDRGLSDEELRDTVLTLLLAGHETTANALSWSFTLLAQHESANRRLQQELDRVLRDNDPDTETLPQLKYTQQVFAETIRLYPSIWIMERRAVENDQIAGIPIPAGSTVLISPYTLHRHQTFWEDPEHFLPDRFENDSDPPPIRPAYIPFGAGPHTCIGQAMAQLVAKLVLAMVGRRFQLTLVDGQQLTRKPGITLRHGTPVWMRIEQRRTAGLQAQS